MQGVPISEYGPEKKRHFQKLVCFKSFQDGGGLLKMQDFTFEIRNCFKMAAYANMNK